MALTKVTSGVRTLGAGEVATANMAVDPTNASNLSSGSVPTAQLGNVDTATLEDDIALLGFKVAVNGSLAKYNLVDQTEDAFMDATGIDASASTGETRNASNYYSGVSSLTAPTGGTKTTYAGYVVHTFLIGDTGQSFVVNAAMNLDYLVIGGGGGGGNHAAGAGGGAGGMVVHTNFSTAIGSYTTTVGDGGTGGTTGSGTPGTDGGDSSIGVSGTTTADGGGGSLYTAVGNTGGSGGGGGGSGTNAGGTGTGDPGGTANVAGNWGNDGGAGYGSSYIAGGGGGASAVGTAGAASQGGAGGAGLANNFRTGVNVTYAGGGGGGCHDTGTGGAAGSGGGGRGADYDTGGVGGVTAGTDDTGGGGGGAGGASFVTAGSGRDGGSGIVVIRYADGALLTYADMVLQSNSTTAETTATKGDIVMTYTNGVGTATLNTDLTAEFSADNGSNWTSMTLAAQGTTGSASPHFIVSAHNVTAGVSGTGMKYRIKTLNQSAAKETRIQAVSLGWS